MDTYGEYHRLSIDFAEVFFELLLHLMQLARISSIVGPTSNDTWAEFLKDGKYILILTTDSSGETIWQVASRIDVWVNSPSPGVNRTSTLTASTMPPLTTSTGVQLCTSRWSDRGRDNEQSTLLLEVHSHSTDECTAVSLPETASLVRISSRMNAGG